MNYLNRAIASIKRQPVKTILLFFLIFVLSSFMAAALIATNAVSNTEANLRKNMRPLATIDIDSYAWQDWFDAQNLEYWDWDNVNEAQREFMIEHIDFNQLRRSHIYQVAELPYVEWVNYSLQGAMTNVPYFSGFSFLNNDQLPTIWITGTSDNTPLLITEDVVTIVEGRGNFTDEELLTQNGIIPVILSEQVAYLNGFHVGQHIEIIDRIFFAFPFDDSHWNWHDNPDNIWHERTLTFEIIGIFEFNYDESIHQLHIDDFNWPLILHIESILNTFHIPNIYLEYVLSYVTYTDMSIYMYENNMLDGNFMIMWESDIPGMTFLERSLLNFSYSDFSIAAFFMLRDPMYTDYFRQAVEDILPFGFTTILRPSGFDAIETSMESIQAISFGLLFASIIATILILSLLITLFLHDRRHEIGIYLAVGEKKYNVIKQVLAEVIFITFIAITLSLFTGNFVSSQLTTTMIRNELSVDQAYSFSIDFTVLNPFYWVGLHHNERSPEELFEAFDVSLNTSTIGLFYIIGIGTITLSTVVPIAYIMQIDPKKNLS